MQTTINSPFIPKPSQLHEDHHLHLLQDDDHQHLESLSLRDLPLTSADDSHPLRQQQSAKINHSRRRSSSSSCSDPTSDFFFEFLINHDDDLITSSADDVIFHGRLLPFTPPPPRRSLSLSSIAARLTRSQLTESSSPPAIRPSRSLNYRKLHRKHKQKNEKKKKLRRNSNPSKNNSGYIDNNNNNNSEKIIPAKLPWYLIAFGLPVKIPAEMELKDIRNRQFRRRLFSDDRNNSCSSSASWRLLSVLSCKSHATVDVSNKAPFRNSLV